MSVPNKMKTALTVNHTQDIQIFSLTLSQLSYRGVPIQGLEPWIYSVPCITVIQTQALLPCVTCVSCVKGKYANHLYHIRYVNFMHILNNFAFVIMGIILFFDTVLKLRKKLGDDFEKGKIGEMISM